MRSNGKAAEIVQSDSCEWLKRRVFQKLNELARSTDIAVIFRIMQEDPAKRRVSSHYHSTGPKGSPEMCLFCGWGHKKKDFVHMGDFVADPWCHYDFIDQPIGATILERDNHRPDVIILTIWEPGSLDDAILGLAWGLAAHKLSSRSNSISPDRMKREIDAQATKLVRQLEVQLA
jgi:hypothetical protein